MSTQSILYRNIDSVHDAHDKIVLDNANDYLLKKRFALGDGADMDKVKHSMRVLSMICTKNCDLVEYLNKIILEGEDLSGTCFSCSTLEPTIQFSDYTDIFQSNL